MLAGSDVAYLTVEVLMSEGEATVFALPRSTGGGTQEGTDAVGDALLRVWDEDLPFLYYKGQDLTDTLVGCIESSGFSVPTASIDPAEEELEKQAMAEVSNEWATCAREAGLVDVQDAVVAVDNWDTMPEVVVPVSTDIEVLREVLAQCPPINLERNLMATQDVYGEGGDTQAMDPRIGFDAPADDPKRQALQQVISDEEERLYTLAQGTG
ncbi:MAG: hypothetical protein LBR27_08480 [Bifidobacteriaceae bacterium]|jgi:hypothetical protein|nr:hypothetical protein [Bifidobacteriaceae bacterium]